MQKGKKVREVREKEKNMQEWFVAKIESYG